MASHKLWLHMKDIIYYNPHPTPPPYVDLTIYTNQIVLIYIYIYKISKNKLDTSVEI